MTNAIVKTITINAPRDRVWQALTDHQEFGAWFKVSLDGPFNLGQVSTGTMEPPNCHIKWRAVIKAMEKPHYFAYTWHPYAIDANIDYSGESQTLVEFKLEQSGKETILTVSETGFDAIPAHRRAEAYPKHENGWQIQLGNIQAYVEKALMDA